MPASARITPGIRGLDYLDQIDLAASTADAQTCHIGDGDHMLEHGIISHVNRAAAAPGCTSGQSVRDCAELMRTANVPATAPPSITEGARFVHARRSRGAPLPASTAASAARSTTANIAW
jgi:hypothetical protein